MNSKAAVSGPELCGSSERFRFMPPSYLLDSPVGRHLLGERWRGLYSTTLPESLDCVIVGGGLAAITVASYLQHAGIEYCIVDTQDEPAKRFRTWCHAIGMRVMRSPYEHYVGCHTVYDYSMLDIAKMCESSLEDFERDQLALASAGQRGVVPLDVFEAHLYHTIRAHEIGDRWCVDQVVRIASDSGPSNSGRFRLSLASGGEIRVKAVIVAGGEDAVTPDIADPRFIDWSSCADVTEGVVRPLVVGAGQTAANVVYSFLRKGVRVTSVISGEEFNHRCVDSTTEMFQPAGRFGFRNADEKADYSFPASVMWEFSGKFKTAEDSGMLEIWRNAHLAVDKGDVMVIDKEQTMSDIEAFDAIIPCFGIAERALVRLGLSGESLDDYCRDRNGVFYVGASARSVIGPAARNIDGHRVCAERVLSGLRDTL